MLFFTLKRIHLCLMQCFPSLPLNFRIILVPFSFLRSGTTAAALPCVVVAQHRRRPVRGPGFFPTMLGSKTCPQFVQFLRGHRPFTGCFGRLQKKHRRVTRGNAKTTVHFVPLRTLRVTVVALRNHQMVTHVRQTSMFQALVGGIVVPTGYDDDELQRFGVRRGPFQQRQHVGHHFQHHVPHKGWVGFETAPQRMKMKKRSLAAKQPVGVGVRTAKRAVPRIQRTGKTLHLRPPMFQQHVETFPVQRRLKSCPLCLWPHQCVVPQHDGKDRVQFMGLRRSLVVGVVGMGTGSFFAVVGVGVRRRGCRGFD